MHGFPLFLALTLQTAASAATPEELLRGAAVDWTKIRTLSVRVSRLTTKDRATQREQWKFQFRQPEQFRIDYSFPQERLIVTDDQEMLEYLPALHRAARTRFMTPAKREALKKQILNRVAITGSHLGAPEDLLAHFDWKAEGDHLVGKAKRGDGRLLLWLGKGGLAKGELYDQDHRLVLRQTASDFHSFGALSFPLESRTEVFLPTPFQVEIRLRDLRINEPLATPFRFVPPEGVGITDRTL